jgi:hypothetical protein
MIATEEKKTMADRNKGLLQKFIEENCWQIDGHTIKYSEFYERFLQYIRGSGEEGDWSKIKLTRSLPLNCPSGSSTKDANQKYIGNISWRLATNGSEIIKPEPLPKCRLDDGKLVN